MVPRPRIVSLNPESFEDVLDGLLTLGEAVGMQDEARRARDRLLERVSAVDDAVATAKAAFPDTPAPSVAFIEWPDPIYVGGHWTPQIIRRAGGSHPLNEPAPSSTHAVGASSVGAGRSFAVPAEDVVASKPTLIVVCPCGLDLPATRREASPA